MSVGPRLGKNSSVRVSEQRGNCCVRQSAKRRRQRKEGNEKVKRENGTSLAVL